MPTPLGLLLYPLSCTEIRGLLPLLQTNRPTLRQQTDKNVSLTGLIVAWSLVWPLGKATRSHTVWFQGRVTNSYSCQRTVLLNEIKLWSVYTVYDTHIMAIFISPDHPYHSNVTRIRGISSAFLQLSSPHNDLVRRNLTPKAGSCASSPTNPITQPLQNCILLPVSPITGIQSSETKTSLK